MSKFQFRLEPVLRQRAQKEASAEQALAAANNEYNRCLALLEDTRRRLEEIISVAETGPDLFEEIHRSFYRDSLAEKVDNRAKDAAEAGRVVDARRDEAVRARQDRQVLEKIKDRRRQDHRREAAAREQRIADELALYTHLRRLKQPQPGVV